MISIIISLIFFKFSILTLFFLIGALYERIWGNGKIVHERHRHRYEVNPTFINQIEKEASIRFIGRDNDTGQRMEFVEISNHPFFIATQAHPEFKSRPLRPSPLFVGLIEAAILLHTSR